jgi:hypothetical protein
MALSAAHDSLGTGPRPATSRHERGLRNGEAGCESESGATRAFHALCACGALVVAPDSARANAAVEEQEQRPLLR